MNAQRSYYIHTCGTYLGVLEYIIVAAVHMMSSHRVPYNNITITYARVL